MSTNASAAPDDDLQAIAAAQRRELAAAQAFESDLDLAFRLQMEEAITASLSLHPAPSSSSTPPPPIPQNEDAFNFSTFQAAELEKLEQYCADRRLSESEARRIRDDLHRRVHDRDVAHEIHGMSEDEWEECGDDFERPFGEGSSNRGSNEIFRVYFKGLVSEARVGNSKGALAGIGVAICDSRDELIFQLKKPLLGIGNSRRVAEAKSLIEGLNAAIALDLKRVVFYCDYFPIHQLVTGRWPAKQRKIATLINQVTLLRKKFLYSATSFVSRNDIKFAFKLAREAIVSQIERAPESISAKNIYENCVICVEDRDVSQMFSVDGCLHRYCFSCMKQHVEVKLLHGMVPKCPHEGCNSELEIDSCRKFLTPKLVAIMDQRMKEASIPVTEKVYCPYPKCSALMSKVEVLEHSKKIFVSVEPSGIRKCTKCGGLFCINCKVPWHKKMSCLGYKRENPTPLAEDAKLKTLADRNLWRQCVKCNHMIELAAGCYHMTCRCGYEFCYTCGAEWKNKKATCTCPLWDEDYILDDEDEDEDEDDDEDDDDDEDVDDYDEFDSDEDDYY
ncbi:E3 ubiquitin-protein ligase RSL1-like [Actinidia eriantha]|uniref:E3 ubiquitin-protein ligase RSL1-like n=1 Tax=Actinidia eriantha TaxID=165200 RepID=UPI00258778B1|nr:E3 ubiquitin-protein ligase RSL1-like [Actinidia eriantha]